MLHYSVKSLIGFFDVAVLVLCYIYTNANFFVVDRYWILFFNSTFLLKSLHKYPLNICELFYDVKIKSQLFGKTPQNQTHKTSILFHRKY